jgi:transglutaminase-like putative cysteine protease
VNGLVYMEEAQGFLYHSWNESLVDGRWRPVDPTFGQVVADATHVKLVEGESIADLTPLLDMIGRVKARVISYE